MLANCRIIDRDSGYYLQGINSRAFTYGPNSEKALKFTRVGADKIIAMLPMAADIREA